MQIFQIQTERSVKPAVFVLLAGGLFLGASARAQLGEAQVEGLTINARTIYRSGNPRDPDCSVGLQFRGQRLLGESHLGAVRILDVVDDLGNNLMETNRSWRHVSFSGGNWQSIDLKCAANNAKSIAIEGEVDLLTPTIGPPVITNFMLHPEVVLKHPVLDEYQIKLVCIHREGTSTNDVEIQLEDPRGKFRSFVFQRADGTVPMVKFNGEFSFGSKGRNFLYSFPNAHPEDLRLVVRVAVPERSETIHFKLKEIRLPWIEPKELEVRVAGVNEWPAPKGAFCYGIQLSFAGGPLTNALGIRKLSINKIESDSGEKLELDPLWSNLNSFSERQKSEQGSGRVATGFVVLKSSSAMAGKIKILQGEAELFHPAANNGGVVEVDNVFARPGEPIDNPVLRTNGVVLKFLGEENYWTKTNEWWHSEHGATVSGGGYDEPRKEIKDSLMFYVDDPNQQLLTVSSLKLSLLDEQGNVIAPVAFASSGKNVLYTFRKTPQSGHVRLYLATPESLSRVPFKVENVLLP